MSMFKLIVSKHPLLRSLAFGGHGRPLPFPVPLLRNHRRRNLESMRRPLVGKRVRLTARTHGDWSRIG
jgi:hypothetical protein